MKEINLPPILFLLQWIYNITRWLLGYYTCSECGQVKNVFKSKKHEICSWNIFQGNHNERICCDECYISKGLK